MTGSAAILKPMENSTTLWVHCNGAVHVRQLLLKNRGLALTSRTAGGDVVLEAGREQWQRLRQPAVDLCRD